MKSIFRNFVNNLVPPSYPTFIKTIKFIILNFSTAEKDFQRGEHFSTNNEPNTTINYLNFIQKTLY